MMMINNGLKMNQEKTELALISSRFRTRPVLEVLQLGDKKIQPKPTVRNLGIIFDQCPYFEDNVKQICRTSPVIPPEEH